MIYDNPFEFLVYHLSLISILIIYFSSKILRKNRAIIGFKGEKPSQEGYFSFKKKVFLIVLVLAVFIWPIQEIKKINNLKNREIECAIGYIDQSEKNLEDEIHFKEFILEKIDGHRKFFDGNYIDPDEAIAKGKQTYVLFYKRELFKVAYMEENIEVGQLKETQERLIDEYLKSINLNFFDKENISKVYIELYVISVVLMIIASISLLKLIIFTIRYHSLIKKLKNHHSEERGRIHHERNYNDRSY